MGVRTGIVYSSDLSRLCESIVAEEEAEASGDHVQVGRHTEGVRVVADQPNATSFPNKILDGVDRSLRVRLRRSLEDEHRDALQRGRSDLLRIPLNVVVVSEALVELAVVVDASSAKPLGSDRLRCPLPVASAFVQKDDPVL